VRSLTYAGLLTGIACRNAPPLRLGTTTTVEQSGFLVAAESLWAGPRLAVVIAPSGQILRSAASGDLDLALTHAPALEAQWLAGNPGGALLRCPFVWSEFAIVGPSGDPAQVAAAATAADGFRRIAHAGARFVSRGDSSGTHERELSIWRAAGITPAGRLWYVESGTDQGATLHLADERRAYALADLPTFRALKGLQLRVLFTGDSVLRNTYTLYLVRTAALHPTARGFVDWAMSTWRQHLPAGFTPQPGACAPPS